MKNMQWRGLKILLFILGIQFLSAGFLFAQISSFRLQQADSLFRAKRYTQSMEHYHAIFKQKQYTPAMLLKMAYVEEGLGQTGQALYHLNLYYEATNDKNTLDKMEELADKYHLAGYKQTDADRFLTFYHDFHGPVGVALMAIAFFLLALSFYLKRKKHKPVLTLALLSVVLVALLVHSNAGTRIASGVIAKNNTRLMDGPSPGASVVSIVEEGHRVEIVGKNDVWLKIKWQDETAYIKESNLLPLGL